MYINEHNAIRWHFPSTSAFKKIMFNMTNAQILSSIVEKKKLVKKNAHNNKYSILNSCLTNKQTNIQNPGHFGDVQWPFFSHAKHTIE